MYRIDSEANVNGRFSDGDATGPEVQKGTVLSADWLNTVQESLCKVIESQGFDLKKGDITLLLSAIEKLVEKVVAPVRADLNKVKKQIGGT